MFKDILKHLRKQKNITQVQLAEAIGVSAGNVGDWENGKSHPGYKALTALSNYFDVSADRLLGLEHKDSLTNQEEEMVMMLRTMEERDSNEIFDLVTFKYYRSLNREA